jgi:hypothetical protein
MMNAVASKRRQFNKCNIAIICFKINVGTIKFIYELLLPLRGAIRSLGHNCPLK